MNIPFVPADSSNYYSGRGGNSIKYIVMHYTANDGDTDEGNAHYFQGAGRRASAHYFVDEDSVTQSVRDNDAAWHCGGALESSHHPLRGICMNRNSLGVEMCSDIVGGKYTITPQTVDRAVELVKYLMAKYGIDVDHVVRHYDVTGKDCPEPWVRDESLWRKFKARLTAPVEPEPKKEDDEVVEEKKVLLNGKTYECDVITKDATNYIKMRSLQQAGFTSATMLFVSCRASPRRSAAHLSRKAMRLYRPQLIRCRRVPALRSRRLSTCSATSGVRIS